MKMASSIIVPHLRYGLARFTRSALASNTVPRVYLQKWHVSQAMRPLSTSASILSKDTITVTYVMRDQSEVSVKTKVGQNLLDIALDNDLDIDGFGACEGTLACSTCHLLFQKEVFDKLPDEPTDEELDMLDLAYGLTDRSRLGCQICVTKDMDGMKVYVPDAVADARTV